MLMSIEDLRHRLRNGMKISFYPDGDRDEREIGYVKSITDDDAGVIVSLPHDPTVEEEVAYENVAAIES